MQYLLLGLGLAHLKVSTPHSFEVRVYPSDQMSLHLKCGQGPSYSGNEKLLSPQIWSLGISKTSVLLYMEVFLGLS